MDKGTNTAYGYRIQFHVFERNEFINMDIESEEKHHVNRINTKCGHEGYWGILAKGILTHFLESAPVVEFFTEHLQTFNPDSNSPVKWDIEVYLEYSDGWEEERYVYTNESGNEIVFPPENPMKLRDR